MVKCVFCGVESYPHTGIHLINNDGSVSYFCSSKCQKNSLKLKRDKRTLKWTEAYRITKAKVIAASVKAAEKLSSPVSEKPKTEKAKSTKAKK